MMYKAGQKILLELFGRRLRLLREDAGLSQHDLSLETGIAAQAISRYENGKIAPTLSTILNLAKGLGIDAKELVISLE